MDKSCSEFIRKCAEKMDSHLSEVVDCICNVLKSDCECAPMKAVSEFTKEMIYYNLEGGKKLRACLFLATYNSLHCCGNINNSDSNMSICEEHVNSKTALYMLAWTIEMIQASFLVSDDLMDISQYRRGKPCWYIKLAERNRRSQTESDVLAGITAFNDSFLLCHGCGYLMHTYFSGDDFIQIMTELNEVCLRTTIGQQIDMDRHSNDTAYQYLRKIKSINSPEERAALLLDLGLRYDCTVKYKTYFYSFRMPIRLAYILAKSSFKLDNICDAKLPEYEVLTNLAVQMSRMFQIRDDMIDWCNDLSNSQKSKHSDIMEGKLSWPFITSIRRIDELNDTNMLDLIVSNYGGTLDQSHVVVELYKKLQIYEIYKQEMSDMKQSFMSDLRKLNHTQMETTLSMFLEGFCLAS
ncbi:hypothetical protein GJ496_011716 [Pomphorhynchus laevis]|nr:hypothetical protein GJ496_011716 [Pomphorhynchus laevis]